MRSGHAVERRKHYGDGQAMNRGEAEESKGSRAVQILVSASGAGAEKYEGKDAEKFSGKLLRDVVHQGPPADHEATETAVILAGPGMGCQPNTPEMFRGGNLSPAIKGPAIY
ncbi:MAG: hypothetical protein NVS9B4_23210 [Candidatus Acidiferrum sp.]